MGGKIVSKQDGTIVVYSYKKDNKPKVKKRQQATKKEIKTKEEEIKEVKIGEQTSLLNIGDNE